MATEKNDLEKEEQPQETTKEPQKITIELYKYKTLIDALEDRHKVKRVVFTIFFLGILLFAGITVITLSIKRLYPYSDITTNGLGATTIKSEKNEVSYWLFNTAILWANSGITVDKGDIITIRASGKSHTAIHHLYDAASTNTLKHNDWVGSEGEPDMMSNERDKIRRKFRIFPDMPSGALLMQVVEKDTPIDNPEDGDPDNFYFIGKERQHIYINNSGTLYFTVNDIILNRHTIANMMWESIRLEYPKDSDTKERIDKYLATSTIPNISLKKELHLKEKDSIEWKDSLKSLFEDVFKTEINEANEKNNLLDHYFNLPLDSTYYSYINEKLQLKQDDSIILFKKIQDLKELTVKDSCKKIGEMKLGYTRQKDGFLVCELSYYYGTNPTENEKCKRVWFDDNIGSFLIVVEKTK